MDKGLAEVSHVLLSHGVTAYCPTIVTSSHQYYDKVYIYEYLVMFMYLYIVCLYPVHVILMSYINIVTLIGITINEEKRRWIAWCCNIR